MTTEPKLTAEERLKKKIEDAQKKLKALADKKQAAQREKHGRLDQLIGAACRSDETMHGAIKAALSKSVKAPKDREFLKVEGWL